MMGPMVAYGMKRQATMQLFRFAIVMLMGALACIYVNAHEVIGLAAATVIFFTGFNYLEASLPSLIAKHCPVGAKGSAMGIYTSCQFLGAFAGGALGGSLYEFYTVQTVFNAPLCF